MFHSSFCIACPIPLFQGVAKSEIYWFVFHSVCTAEHRFNTYYPDDFWQRAVWKCFSRINYSPQYLCGQHLVNWPFYTTAHGQLLWKVPELKYSNPAHHANCGFFVRSLLYPGFLWSFDLIHVCMSWLSAVNSRISSLSSFCLGTWIMLCHGCNSISGITLDEQLGTSKLCWFSLICSIPTAGAGLCFNFGCFSRGGALWHMFLCQMQYQGWNDSEFESILEPWWF